MLNSLRCFPFFYLNLLVVGCRHNKNTTSLFRFSCLTSSHLLSRCWFNAVSASTVSLEVEQQWPAATETHLARFEQAVQNGLYSLQTAIFSCTLKGIEVKRKRLLEAFQNYINLWFKNIWLFFNCSSLQHLIIFFHHFFWRSKV